MSDMSILREVKADLKKEKAEGIQNKVCSIDDLLWLINLAQFGIYFWNLRELNEGQRSKEFMRKETEKALKTGSIPTFADFWKSMHVEAAK